MHFLTLYKNVACEIRRENGKTEREYGYTFQCIGRETLSIEMDAVDYSALQNI